MAKASAVNKNNKRIKFLIDFLKKEKLEKNCYG